MSHPSVGQRVGCAGGLAKPCSESPKVLAGRTPAAKLASLDLGRLALVRLRHCCEL